ncbi:MAG: exo-alpha-sialidase, partial [Candidatus Latescibacterota bacterium]
HLSACLSQDDGKVWRGGLLLDERLHVSYPDAVEAPDGTITLVYDYDRKGDKKILLSQFVEADILKGVCVSEQAKLQILVNQAFGKNSNAT